VVKKMFMLRLVDLLWNGPYKKEKDMKWIQDNIYIAFLGLTFFATYFGLAPAALLRCWRECFGIFEAFLVSLCDIFHLAFASLSHPLKIYSITSSMQYRDSGFILIKLY